MSLIGPMWRWPLTYWPKINSFFYSIRAIILWSFKAQGLRVLELLSGNGFHSVVHCDLDLWPTDPTINREKRMSPPRAFLRARCWRKANNEIHVCMAVLIRATTLWGLKALAQRVLKLLSGNGFYSSGHCDLDLWPTDPKIKRGLLPNKDYHPIKLEGSGPKGTQVIERKMFFTLRVTVTLTFDLLNPKSIGAITLWSLKTLDQRVLELLSGNGFHFSGHCDLDLWPTDPKINRGLLLNKGYHPMKFECSGSKGTRELLSGNEVWQTDRRT